MKKFIFIMMILTISLVACGGNESGGDAAKAVETYLQAKVTSDEATIRGLLCSEMEAVVEREVHTFDGVQDATIEDMACTDAGNGRITCTGTIVALYGTEETEFPLTNYKAVQEDGEWKWCGETE